MVKFAKELEAKLIPEWRDAFVDYWALKKRVKNIKVQRKSAGFCAAPAGKEQGLSFLRPVRRLEENISDKQIHEDEKDDAVAQVMRVDVENCCDPKLETLTTLDAEVKEFFECLEEELKKVNRFYRSKESEFLERGEILKKQLHILLDIKRLIHERYRKSPSSRVHSIPLSPRPVSLSRQGSEFSGRAAESLEAVTEIVTSSEMAGRASPVLSARTKGSKAKALVSGGMKIEIPATTPSRALSALFQALREDVNNGFAAINRKKVRHAEKMIRGAYVELYKELSLLKSYSTLNFQAFTKILKKFDKVCSENASAIYLPTVRTSVFITSDKVVRLAEEVESIFTKHFAGNDRRSAMKYLRPRDQQKSSKIVTFFVGLLMGCCVMLFTVYAFLAHLSGSYFSNNEIPYLETIYPLLSILILISLHMVVYGFNLWAWRRSRINYNFIFDFSPTTSLKPSDAFLIGASFMALVACSTVVHLILKTNGFSPSFADNIPRILLLILTAVLIFPLNVFYRSTRYFFLRVLRHIICSPFYKVVMADFFMADQFTSQVTSFRHMELTACYMFATGFKTHHPQTCTNRKFFYKEFAYAISFLPYYWRAIQCARRWFDEGDLGHLENLGKYVSTMVAAGARIAYARYPTTLWLAIVVITSTLVTTYQIYWDLVKDWGLLNPRSKNPWLRDELILKRKTFYYVAIVVNFVLRIAWVEAVMNVNIRHIDHRLLEFALASVEVIRRGQWNFYRVENEHLNNVGKFRAVKTMPLPFREMEDDD